MLIVLIGVVVGILIGCDTDGWLIAFGASVTLSAMRLLPPLAVMAPVVFDVIDYLSFDDFFPEVLERWGDDGQSCRLYAGEMRGLGFPDC